MRDARYASAIGRMSACHCRTTGAARMTTNSLSRPHGRHTSVYRLRGIDRAAIVTIVVWLFVVFTAPNAFAAPAADMGGRYDSTFDGSGNKLVSTAAKVNSASPSSGSCVLFSVVLATGSLQLETGLTTCNGTSIDGSCGSGQTFVETWISGAFHCVPYGSFAIGSYYSIGVARTGTGQWVGQVAGVNHQGMSGWPSTVYARTWGEWTTGNGTHTCTGWSGAGFFSGWTYTSNSGTINNFTSSNTAVAAGCWTVGSISGAAYSVSH